MVFLSPHHEASYEELPGLVRKDIGSGMLLSCSGTGIIGDGREIEDCPALSITAAHLPDVDILPFHLDASDLSDVDATPNIWEITFNIDRDRGPDFLLLSDPFSMPMDRLLSGLNSLSRMRSRPEVWRPAAHSPGVTFCSSEKVHSGQALWAFLFTGRS